MTDITELAQRNELLIANGNETVHLLRHLAENEIDSDYFAVVTECESYGMEVDAELEITKFARHAAEHVAALVEALEKAQSKIIELQQKAEIDPRTHEIIDLKERIIETNDVLCNLLPDCRYMDPPDGGSVTPLEQVSRMIAYYRQRIAGLESRTVKLPKKNIGWDRDEDDCWNNAIDACAEAMTAAGIKWGGAE